MRERRYKAASPETDGRVGMRHWNARYPELHDAEWLRARIAEGLSDDKIAELIDFDCTRHAVFEARKRNGIPAARRATP